MSGLRANIALFVLLTLVPALILAWLGLRSSAPLVDELRSRARDDAARWAELAASGLEARITALRQDDARAVAAAAARLRALLPDENGGAVLRQLEQELGDGALRLLAADGGSLVPRGPADTALPHLPEWRGFLDWQRALDAGETGVDLLAAARRFEAPALRVRALALCLRQQPEQAAAALAPESWPAFAAAGPLPCEVLAGSAAGRELLASAAATGWLYTVPATERARAAWLEAAGAGATDRARQQLRAAAEQGGCTLRTTAPVLGDAVLELLRDGVGRLPAAAGQGSDACELTFAAAAAPAPLSFPGPATAQLAVPTSLGVVAVTAAHRGLHRLEREAARQRWLTGLGIGMLLLVMVAGTALVRRALLHERRARTLRDDFLANVSHELKTPLTSLRLHAEMLAGDGLEDGTRRRYGEVAQAEGARLSALVDDLLDFAALERGRRRIEPEPVDLGRAVREFAASWAPLCTRDGVQLQVAADGEVPALCDPTALSRILGNLLQNALRHGRPPRHGQEPRIELRAGPGPSIEVSDNGPGVPAADRERVFARFERAGRGGAGFGLGLALSRELAIACGGSLSLHDDGRDTTFRLELPALPALGEDAP